MPKKDPISFLEKAIEECWLSQRNLLTDKCEDFVILDAQVAAYQDVYKYLAGDEYAGHDESTVFSDPDRMLAISDEDDDDEEEESTPESRAVHTEDKKKEEADV